MNHAKLDQTSFLTRLFIYLFSFNCRVVRSETVIPRWEAESGKFLDFLEVRRQNRILPTNFSFFRESLKIHDQFRLLRA